MQSYFSRGRKGVLHIDIGFMNDDALSELNESMSLSLSMEEMRRIRDFFRVKQRAATDVELHCIAQAWSEHCSYKSSRKLLKKYLFPLAARAYMTGDAGVMSFDGAHVYSLKMESHNHPSAIEPYGGAGTGIGGIVRDILCMGTRPIALADPLFFGRLETPESELPKGTKHPKYLFSGVVAGIRDYGNRIGVPTVSGGVWFDERYISNCLVNAGCVGFGKKEHVMLNRFKAAGEKIVLAGGLTGKDGIHGVNFASRVLTEKSEEGDRGAVQLGDPITKEPLINAVLELVHKGAISSMKDLGGGGLSACAGEMAHAGGKGAMIDLSAVPLREKGMMPWEIWISESQERMLLAVEEGKVPAVLETFEFWDVSAAVIGEVIDEQRIICTYDGATVLNLETEFAYGTLEYERKSERRKRVEGKPVEVKIAIDEAIDALLSDENICSRDWIVHMYDFEVGGRTVIKPLNGLPPVLSHGDAAVLKPLRNSWRGLGVSVAAAPWTAMVDPYTGAITAVDELCRNLISVGARPDALTNCLNFGNPERAEVMWEFEETLRGLSDACKKLGIAVPSGNVSFYNESPSSQIPPTVALMGVGIVDDIRLSVSSDIKRAGSNLYLVGDKRRSLSQSAFGRIYGAGDGTPLLPDLGLLSEMRELLLNAMKSGLILSCHDVSDGGIFVTVAEMCFGGNIGATMDISTVTDNTVQEKLFAEGTSQWIIEVGASMSAELEDMLGEKAVKIGTTGGSEIAVYDRAEILYAGDLRQLKEKWQSRLWKEM